MKQISSDLLQIKSHHAIVDVHHAKLKTSAMDGWRERKLRNEGKRLRLSNHSEFDGLMLSLTTKTPLGAAPVWLLLTGSHADWYWKDCRRVKIELL